MQIISGTMEFECDMNTAAATAITKAEIILPSLFKLRSKGVLPLDWFSSMSAISPIWVLRPTPVTTAEALPCTTNVEENSMLRMPPRGVFASFITHSHFSAAVDSPVSADSSAFNPAHESMRQSAGTRSPSESSTTSPTVNSAAGILFATPSRRARAVGAESFLSCSMALSARYCCTAPTTALRTIIEMIITVSVRSERSCENAAVMPDIAAAATSNRVMTSPNCEKNSHSTPRFFCFSITF